MYGKKCKEDESMISQVKTVEPPDIWRCYHWFPCQMMSRKQAQKFHTDDDDVTTQIWGVLLIGSIKFPT